MQTLAELTRLGRSTWQLLRLAWPELVAWFCLSWIARRVGLYGSAMLGADHPFLSILVFIAGFVAHVAGMVMMIASLQRHALPAAATVPQRPAVSTLAATIGSFLAVFAVWGLVDEQIRELFTANVVRHGLLGVDAWSVDLRRWQTYAWIGAAGWIVKRLLGLVAQRRPHPLLVLATAAADAVFVFGSALALVRIGASVASWLRQRVIVAWLTDGWRAAIDMLPDIRLPFDLTVPEAVAATTEWILGTLVPGVWLGVALPLVWLALTAVVFGWGDFDGEGNAAQAERLRAALPRPLRGIPTPLLRASALAGDDIRLKYEPVVAALRMVLRAGLPFVGAFLVAATLITTADRALTWALITARGPVPVSTVLVTEPLHELLGDAIALIPACALYAAAVARCLSESGSAHELDRLTPVRHT